MRSLLPGIVVPLLLIWWSSGNRKNRAWPAVAVLILYGFGLISLAAANVRAPHEWDYACFWLYGHIAAAHLNVYDPAVYAHFPLPFPVSDEFRRVVLDVGFPYPPPTIALFLPLGFIASVPASLTLWYGVQFAALGAAAWVLARTFLPGEGWGAVVLIAAIVTALPASLNTVGDAQTNFLLLLLVTLAFQQQHTARGAVWQVLAVWVKPFAAALFLLDIVRGRWRRLAVAGLTLTASLLGAALLLGPAALISFVRANPAGRQPNFAFIETVNQSLLAIVLRLHAILPPHISPLAEPLYVVFALGLTALTIALCAGKSVSGDIAFASLLLLGLIVYPGTLSSYGVSLVIPLLVIWRHRNAFPGRRATAAAILALALVFSSAALQFGFEANVLLWLACIFLLVAERYVSGARQPDVPHRAQAARAAG